MSDLVLAILIPVVAVGMVALLIVLGGNRKGK